MSNGNGRVALQTQKEECKSAITDIRAASIAMKDAMPGAECPAPAFPRSMITFGEAMARGQIALLRSRVAEIELAEQEMEEARTIIVERKKEVRAVVMTAKKKAVLVLVVLAILGIGAGLRSMDSILQLLQALISK